MYARAVQSLPDADGWLYEIKLDGYRALAGKGLSGVNIWSRRGNLFTDPFPRIAKPAKASTRHADEIFALDEGRISFNLLQHHRVSAAVPARAGGDG